MAELRWTYEADNPFAPEQVIDGIYSTAQVLKDHPEIGHKYQTSGMDEVRILQYGHYRITYALLENRIDILGVFHGALDIDKYL